MNAQLTVKNVLHSIAFQRKNAEMQGHHAQKMNASFIWSPTANYGCIDVVYAARFTSLSHLLRFGRLVAACLAVICLSWIASAHAQDITCRKGDAFRRVYVVVENVRTGLPCEVILWSTPRDQRRIWRAEYERGFCTEKLRGFVSRLTKNRWLCQPTNMRPARPSTGRPQPVM